MSDQKPQNSPISWKPPIHRRAEFDQMVSESELSRNAFMTEAIFGGNRHRPGESKFLARILGMCQRIADKLHEIALSSPHNALLLEQIRDELITIRTILMQALGRRS